MFFFCRPKQQSKAIPQCHLEACIERRRWVESLTESRPISKHTMLDFSKMSFDTFLFSDPSRKAKPFPNFT